MLSKEEINMLKKQGIFVNCNDSNEEAKIAFMFPGHGAQYPNMLRDLVEKYSCVKEVFEKADNIYQCLTNGKLTEKIFNENIAEEALKSAEVMQTSIFTANFAMFKLMEELNIKPNVLIGHSLGEFAALAAAKVISFEEGLEIVYHRAQCLNCIPVDKRGKMISLKLSNGSKQLEDLKSKLEEKEYIFEVSLNNSPVQTIISGDNDSIKFIESYCNENQIVFKVLNASHAFHSKILSPAVEKFKKVLMNYTYNAPQIDIFSTIDNKLYSKNKEEYSSKRIVEKLSKQFITPFSFNNDINILYDQYKIRYFIEVGPSNILTNLVETILKDKDFYCIETNQRKLNDLIAITRLKAYIEVNKKQIKSESGKVINMSREEIENLIKMIIADKTGYPIEVLENELDLEADLGIDSVKQADIFASLFKKLDYKVEQTEDTAIKFNTISEIIDFCVEKVMSTTNSEEEVAVEEVIKQEPIEELASISKEEIMKVVKDIIVNKTGYPVDVLENDLDLEADLGIDSVKQTDIMVAVLNELNYSTQNDGNNELVKLNTIDDIVEYLYSKHKSSLVQESDEESKKDKKKLIAEYSATQKHNRYVAVSKIVEYGENKVADFNLFNKNILLIEDRIDGKLTEELVQKLKSQNNNVVVVGKGLGTYDEGDFVESSLVGEEEIRHSFDKAKVKLEKVHGMISLYSFTNGIDFTNSGYEEWDKEIENTYMVSFEGLKSIYYDIVDFGEEAFFITVSNMGGIVGVDNINSNNTSAGINTGILKAMNKEIDTLHCKVIDFDTSKGIEGIADKIIKEISIVDNIIEVGYIDELRKTIIVLPEELNIEDKCVNNITEDDVILFAGGGRGILNKLIEGISKVYNPTIIVVGRSEIPSGNEEWFKMNDDEFEQYKSRFIKETKEKNKELSVVQILNEYEKLRNNKILYKNIKKLKEISEKIHYYRCDVSNYDDVKSLEKEITEKFGSVTGIINGAGLPSFGSIIKKKEEISLAVVKVKALGLYNLYNVFKGHPLKIFNTAGSISGRFGIDGQVDYVAACDLTVKMISRLRKLNDGVNYFIMDWTAWKEVGMAAIPIVEEIQKSRGLEYIDVDEGVQKFLEEVTFGTEDCEVLIFNSIGGDKNLEYQFKYLNDSLKKLKSPIDSNGRIVNEGFYPYIDKVVKYTDDSLVINKTLNIENDIHLRDHVVKGNYVFAGVSYIELYVEMADLISKLWGNDNWYLYKVNKIELKEFIKYFEKNPLTLKGILNVTKRDGNKITMSTEIRSDFINSKGLVLVKDRLHSIGEIVISDKMLENDGEVRDINKLMENSIELSLEKYYEETDDSIHFGELFRSLNYVRKINSDKFIGEIVAVDDSKLFRNHPRAFTKMFPITMDCIGRVALLGIYNEYGIVAVPVSLNNIVLKRNLRKHELLYSYSIIDHIENDKVKINQEIIDVDGKVICTLDLYLHVISKKDEHNIEIN